MKLNIFETIIKIFNYYEEILEKYQKSILSLDHETINEIENIYDIHDNNSLPRKLNSNPTTGGENDNIDNVSEILKNEEIELKKKIPKTKKIEIDKEQKRILKKLFRKIALISHPDKIKNLIKNELFKKAKTFYENELIIGLIYVSLKLKIVIPITEYSTKIIKIILIEIENMKNIIFVYI